MEGYSDNYTITKNGSILLIAFHCNIEPYSYVVEMPDFIPLDVAIFSAWMEAKNYFNRCHQCGKWVCDLAYNESEMKCINCQPKELKED